MAYYLGLDVGGTKTECALADDHAILGHASGGCIKTMRTPVEEAERNLDLLLQSISTRTGVLLDSIACTCVGLAGISVPRIAAWTRQALQKRLSGDVLLAGDEEIALDAAFQGGPGVLIVAGTGSNFVGRSVSGRMIHIGGWGPVLADEGSGSWIGKHAVRAIFETLDRGETTLMLDRVLQAWGVPDAGGIMDRANEVPGPDFPALTRIVAECAQQHDRAAIQVLKQAGQALAMEAVLVSQTVRGFGHEEDANLEIAFTGGILRHILPVRQAMLAAIARELPRSRVQTEPIDSLQGAIWRARQHSKSA